MAPVRILTGVLEARRFVAECAANRPCYAAEVRCEHACTKQTCVRYNVRPSLNMRFQVRRLSEYSRSTLLEELQRVASQHGQSDFTQSMFRKHSRVSPSTVRRCFGTWEAGLIEAGLLTSAPAKPSLSDAIAELTRVASTLPSGAKLTIALFQLYSSTSPKLIIRLFGTWRRALQAAALERHFDSSSQKIPRSQIVKELRRVADLLGTRELTIDAFEEHSHFGATVARKEFGSWHKATQEAGLIGNSRGEANTDEDCFDNLLAVWTHHGRPPTLREMSRPPSEIGVHAYVRRFGGWIKALEAFAARVEEDAVQPSPAALAAASQPVMDQASPSVEPPAKQKVGPIRLSECDRREIRLGLRYTVLYRDRFRCVVCGRSPATSLGIVLHVDHILAWSKGGKTTVDNLRTTCADCNLGKGARDEG